MASCLTYPISCPVADPFKMFLFVKRGLVIAVSFFVGFDQTEYRVWQGRRFGSRRRQRDGNGRRDVRRHRRGGKTAGASGACEGGNSKESAPRRIYGRVCGWRAKHAISLGHLD